MQSGIPDRLPGSPGSEYDDRPAVVDLNAKEIPHWGFGGGLHLALNENFIIAVDYGFAARKQDGDSGLYINLNFLF